MNGMNPKVNGYLRKNKKWQPELEELRRIILDCRLTEEVKWRVPCYTINNRNIVILGAFKEYCALSFVKGALLKDAHGVLRKPGENTQVARLIRFTDVQEIVELAPILKAYIHEAIEVEKAGLKVKLKKITDHNVPEELQNKLDEIPSLKTAFHALTPGRQRAYLLYFSAPKQSKTRTSRIEKCMQQILNGRGLMERDSMISMKPTSRSDSEAASANITKRIEELGDWRGETLAHVRELIHDADPGIQEEWKWAKAASPGTPVWSHDGIVCTGESYKQVVKLTFARGASIEDPKKLFNSSLEGNTRRAIDLREGEKINEAAFKQLIRAAVAANSRARAPRSAKKRAAKKE